MCRSSARDAGIGARRIDEGNDWQTEFIGQPHQAQGFAIAFGMGGTEIAPDILLGVAAFLGADDHDLLIVEFGKTANHGVVIGKQAVAVQFGEIRENGGNIIECERALGMARDFDPVPGAELGEDLAFGLLDFLLDNGDFLFEFDAHRIVLGMFLEFFQLALQLQNGLLKIKLMFHQRPV